MARSKVDLGRESPARRRLRIPAALAVTVVGSSASVAMTIGGCDAMNPGTDAGPPITSVTDARSGDSLPDAGEPTALADGGIDTKVVDGPIDARPDAAVPRDAPPDTPVV